MIMTIPNSQIANHRSKIESARAPIKGTAGSERAITCVGWSAGGSVVANVISWLVGRAVDADVSELSLAAKEAPCSGIESRVGITWDVTSNSVRALPGAISVPLSNRDETLGSTSKLHAGKKYGTTGANKQEQKPRNQMR